MRIASWLLLGLTVSALTLAVATRVPAAEVAPPYLDSQLGTEQRLNDLLPRMTLQEKISQLHDDWGSAAVPRLKIPALLKTEGLHGNSYGNGAAVYPQAIAMAATWDTALVRRIGDATAVESKAAGIRQSWSPVLDVARDARWGRIEETYGEDPYLVSRMGVAWIAGFQGQGMIATPKHFAAHGQPLGGRDSNDSDLSERAIREVHLEPFRAAIEEAHAGAIMANYGTWNGVPSNASPDLLRGVLQQEWGFDGMVVSDCGAPEQFITKQAIASTPEEAAQLAIQAGVNMECGSIFGNALEKAVRDGLLSEAQLDEGVRRVLRVKFTLGLFEHPGPPRINFDALPGYDAPAHRTLAREVAVESAVLLKNDNNLLPLRKDTKTIAVIGPDADDPQVGDYSAKPSPGQFVSVLQGIKSHVSPGTQVLYAKGCDGIKPGEAGFAEAVATARGADVVVMVIGDQSGKTSGENVDGATLDFPGSQRALVQAVAAVGKPVVLVLVNGKPFTLEWEAEHIPAIVATWYPGEEGGDATADLLFGDRNPSGRLPITFPRSPGQLPLTYDYKPSGRGYNYYDMPFAPRYRFGYGLSYTKFRYSNLQITPQPDDPARVTVTADVQNIGDRDGDEVAQLYVTDLIASVNTPVMQLKGFQRLSLQRGQTKTVRFQLTPYQLSLLDAQMARTVEPGQFRIHVGGVSPQIPNGNENHKKNVGFKDAGEGVSGEFQEPKSYRAQFVCKLGIPDKVSGGKAFPVTLSLTNAGNLTDVTAVTLYGGDHKLDTWRFEVEPGQTKTHTFTPTLYTAGLTTLTAIAGDAMTTSPLTVTRAPAKLDLDRIKLGVDDAGQVSVTARGMNAGSSAYNGKLTLFVNGQSATNAPVTLNPGASQELALTYQLPASGNYKIRLNDAPEQNLAVPGAIGLALQGALINLTFDQTQGTTVKNEVTGNPLPMRGHPTWVEGPHGGHALRTDDADTFVDTGTLDLYRKPFTLAAWVRVYALGSNGDAALFGGQAPMGADQDVNGTVLHAGIQHEKLKFSFFGRTIDGVKTLPQDQWVHIAFTYDPVAERGALYLNGHLDVAHAMQPYAGPLNMIGNSSIFQHGKYALGEVSVLRTCLPAPAIAELAAKGLAALRQAEQLTEWRPSNAAPSALVAWADVPEGSHIMAVIEAGDNAGKVLDTKSVELKNGHQAYALSGLKAGQQVRIRTQLATTKWDASPIVRGYTLTAGNQKLTWSFRSQWAKGTASGGLNADMP